MAEILADLTDINAELPPEVAIADDTNTAGIQISVARIIRGYLRRIIDQATLMSWTDPAHTPETIRLVAAKLIASQFYFQRTAETTTDIPDTHFSQRLYNEAMAILNQIIAGTVILDGITEDALDNLSLLDGFPRTATDRAFTRSMEL